MHRIKVNYPQLQYLLSLSPIFVNLYRLEEGYLREYRWYAKELEEQIRTEMEKRDPYGIRMQAWLEDWLNSVKDRYDCIWKC